MRPAESFIGQPVRSLQTMLRVISMYEHSIPMVIPDGIYGPSTTQAVSAFQRKQELPSTGVVNQETWDQIVNVYEAAITEIDRAESIEILIDPGQTFSRGDSNPYIYLLQSMLIQLSHDHAIIDAPLHTGVMDGSTVRAVSQFQELANLKPNGVVDKNTWKYLVRHFTLNAHHHMATTKE